MKETLCMALAAMGLLASCNKETNEKPAVRVAAEFTEAAISRVANDTWETGDAIGVYMVAKDAALTDTAVIEGAKNIRHTVDTALAGIFTPDNTAETIYFPVEGLAADFYAYYPYQATMVDGEYKVDVSDQSDLSAIDLLTASAKGKDKTTPNVAFKFAHKLSKLSINASAGDGLTAAHLAGLKVEIKGLPTTADYNIATGDLSNLAATPTDIVARMTGTGNLTAEAILIPKASITPGSVQVVFSLTGGMQFGWDLTATALAPGSNYTYTLKLNRTGVTLSSQNITPWGEGNGTGETGTASQLFLPEVVLISAGKFQMGSADGGASFGQNNETLHEVTLSAFKMSKYEITVKQYCAFLNAVHVAKADVGDYASHTVDGYGNQNLFKVNNWGWTPKYSDATGQWESDRNSPMIFVTWYGAKAYADWVGGALPTEAQWEYACRAGTSTTYFFGDAAANLGDYAWYGNTGGETKSVGMKQPNDWGLYDMYGNAWEWCNDRYGDYPTAPAIDPAGPKSGDFRVSRGGSFTDFDYFCRSAVRYYYTPNRSDGNVGFRIVMP